MTDKDKSGIFNEIIDKLSEAPAEIKQAFYEEGRKHSVKKKTFFQQLGYHFGRNNLILALIMIGGIFIAGLWIWSNVFQPVMMKFGLIEQQVYNGYVKVPKSFEIFKGNKPTRNTVSKLEIKTKEDSEGKPEKMILFTDDKGNVYAKHKFVRDIKLVSMQSRFDWRFQPGFGFVADPFAEDSDEIIEPAFVLSPLEIYSKVSLDMFASPNKAGAGLSGKLPFSWTSNTYLGGGLGIYYDDMTQKVFFIYGKVDF